MTDYEHLDVPGGDLGLPDEISNWLLEPEDDDYGPSPSEVALDDWRMGRCFNCGCWGIEIADGEYECGNCGDIWSIYEEPPDIP